MATRSKPAAAADLYERDFPAWARAQADLLRAGRFDDVDLMNLIEEVDDLSRALERSVRSRTITILTHLLKLQHSPAPEPRAGWRDTVRTQRTKLSLALTPSLRQLVEDERQALYARARHDAAGALADHGEHAAADALPETCPYTLAQIEGDWWPAAADEASTSS